MFSKKYIVLAAFLTVIPPSFSAAAADIKVVKVPLNTWTEVANKKGWLQEEFAKTGARVEIVDPSSSLHGQESALLERGELHFASRMIYPAAVQKARGFDTKLIWISGKSDTYRTPILALKDSPINSLKDLKGKTLGSSRIGCGWTSPFEALDAAGVPLDTESQKGAVRFLNQNNLSEQKYALLSGKIDATAAHIALTDAVALITQGHAKIIGRSVDNGVYVNDAGRPTFYTTRDYAEKNPEQIQAFLRVRQKAVKWIVQNPDEAARIISVALRTPVEIVKFQITDKSQFDYMDGEPNAGAAVQSIRNYQKWYAAHGDDILAKNSLSDAQIDDFVDRRFFKGGRYSVYE